MENKKTIEIEISDIDFMCKLVDRSYIKTSRDCLNVLVGVCNAKGYNELFDLFEHILHKSEQADFGN